MIREFQPLRILRPATSRVRGMALALLVILLSASFLVCAFDIQSAARHPQRSRSHRQTRQRVCHGVSQNTCPTQVQVARYLPLAGLPPASGIALVRPGLSPIAFVAPLVLDGHPSQPLTGASLPRPPPISA